MKIRKKEDNFLPTPSYVDDSTEVTMRCYHWGKCKHEPSETYKGGEITVFDEVELSGISIFELDRMVEQARVYGHKVLKVKTVGEIKMLWMGGIEDAGNGNDEGAEDAGDSDFSGKDSDYGDKKNQAIEIRRNEDGGPDSVVDNSDKDDAANSEAEFESLRGSDKEQGMQYPVFDKDMDNLNLEVGMVFSSFKEFKAALGAETSREVWEGTQEAPTQGEAQGTQDAHTVVTQEPSATAVSKSAERSKVSKRTRRCSRNSGGMCYLTQEALTQWDAPGTQETCAAAIPNSPKGKKS
ncbi:hypothetical protein ACH5RR_025386 [Cinchona calisaya]|uniref:Uncharacterized protein n=1 Tax=Cinchona calisaya TaxID=153742 RepID=A0ABD2YZG8_9GENT